MYSNKLIIPSLESDDTYLNNLNNIEDSKHKQTSTDMCSNKYGGAFSLPPTDTVHTGATVLKKRIIIDGKVIEFYNILSDIMTALGINDIQRRHIITIFSKLLETQVDTLFNYPNIIQDVVDAYKKLLEADNALHKISSEYANLKDDISTLNTQLAILQGYSFIVKINHSNPIETQCQDTMRQFISAISTKIETINTLNNIALTRSRETDTSGRPSRPSVTSGVQGVASGASDASDALGALGALGASGRPGVTSDVASSRLLYSDWRGDSALGGASNYNLNQTNNRIKSPVLLNTKTMKSSVLMNDNKDFTQKYLKYKKKYIQLKNVKM